MRTSRAPLRRLQPGECFAEGGLLEHTKMAPSLVAGDSATVLRVGSADFMAAHASWQMELLERKVAALRSALCLASFDERSLRPIAERLALERRHADAVIVAHDDVVREGLAVTERVAAATLALTEKVPLGVRGDALGVGPRTGRVGRVVRAALGPAVLPGDLDLPGQLGGVAFGAPAGSAAATVASRASGPDAAAHAASDHS